MGAYYEGTIETDDGLIRFNPHSVDNGLKLMEHSWLKNRYVNLVLNELTEPKRLSWVCDYTENDYWVWDNAKEVNFDSSDDFVKYKYIINEDKKLFIDVDKLEELYNEQTSDGWHIHPIPILCNIEESSQGGGDFHEEDSRRSIWSKDRIWVTNDEPDKTYQDVTGDCLFFED
jgi:hypothetical protein